jgi:hypothetical protein
LPVWRIFRPSFPRFENTPPARAVHEAAEVIN